ncbi:MAG TPA: hypothetical protein VEN82_02630 [Actinomycetota bacterium]|nr:hypothetical protein [Actinomycetota bacterium]
MGRDARCTARYEGKVSEGTAQLETDFLLFRGDDVRVKVMFAEISTVEVSAGNLRLVWDSESLELDLGPQADAWAERIRNPRTLIDKLGVKPGMRVSVLGVGDPDFLEQLTARTLDVWFEEPVEDSDLIVLRADSVADLAGLEELKRFLVPNGGIWAVSPRGDPTIRDVDVIEAAKVASLVDVKVVRFSQTHTALKLVIPVALR